MMNATLTKISVQYQRGKSNMEEFQDWERGSLDRLIHLVLELEQILYRMVKSGVRLEPRIRTRLIAEFVNCAVAFSESLPKSELHSISLTKQLEEAAGIYPPVQQLRIQHNRLVVGLIMEGGNSGDRNGEPDLPVSMIFKGEVLILDAYLSYFERFLATMSAIDRWRDIREAFLDELRLMLIVDWELQEATPGKTILVVEDNPSQMANMKRMLQGAGYGVLSATTGDDAVRLARHNRPQLILLDGVLPGKSGFQVCRELKGSSDTEELRVVMLVNRNQVRSRSWAAGQSADGYLSKPYQKEELLDTVARHLAHHMS